MIGFKKFLALWVVILAFASLLLIGLSTVLYNGLSNTGQNVMNHFSVHWMGFAPTDYNNSYPEYYVCINNLKHDELTMSIALKIMNQEASGYYFLIENYTTPPAGWTIEQYKIGYVAVDQAKNFVYSNVSRLKPATIPEGILTESIELVVKAYYDATYTDLYSQDNFTATFHFIDRTSPVWTQLSYDDFEDGTTQGWSQDGTASSIELSFTYYRSFQHSLRLMETSSFWYYSVGYKKTFNTASYNTSVLIFSLRSPRWDDYQISVNGITYFKPDATPSANIWYQFAVPLPKGVDQVRIWVAGDLDSAYLDDVYLIAK